MKNDRWVYYKDIPTESGGEGVTKRVLAYSDDVMVVENTFDTGAVGKLHHHPHTQITYVKSGRFLFTIDGEQHEVTEGDTLLPKGKNDLHSNKILTHKILTQV